MKKRKKIWLAGVLATLTIIGTAPASLATETETVTVAQEETVAAAETEVAETTQKNAEESTEAADKAETTAETEQEHAASENSSEASTEEVESTTGEKVIFVLIMVLMFVAPVLLFFILLVIFTKTEFHYEKTGRVPGATWKTSQEPGGVKEEFLEKIIFPLTETCVSSIMEQEDGVVS